MDQRTVVSFGVLAGQRRPPRAPAGVWSPAAGRRGRRHRLEGDAVGHARDATLPVGLAARRTSLAMPNSCPQKAPFQRGIRAPRLIRGSSRAPESMARTASGSLRPFLQLASRRDGRPRPRSASAKHSMSTMSGRSGKNTRDSASNQIKQGSHRPQTPPPLLPRRKLL